MKPLNPGSRNLCRAFGFAVLFAALFLALQPAFADIPSAHQKLDLQSAKAFFRLPKDTLDVIYLGNSHVMSFFASAVLDELLGTQSYNFGSGAQNIQQVYFDLKQVAKYQHPSHVVVEMSAARGDLGENRFTQRSFQTSRYPFGWDRLQAILSQFEPADYPAALFPMLRNHSRWKRPAELLSAFKQTLRVDTSIPEGRGWRAATVIAGMDLESQVGKPKACAELRSDLPARNIEYLNAIVALAREHGITLLFVKTPDRRRLGCRDAALEQFAASNAIPFYDYNVLAFSKTLSRLHYADLQHLNKLGAVPFNLHWAGLLATEMGRTFDEEAKARYEAITISGLLEEASGKQVTYTLLPATAGADLRYSWLATLNGKAVARNPDDLSASAFTLDTSAKGQYRITIQVRDAQRPESMLEGLLRRTSKEK